MEKIAIVLGLGFLFTGAWKWGESKWIRIFQVLQLHKEKIDSSFSPEIREKYNYQYQEAVMARKSRHKMTAFMVALFVALSYAFLGLTWAGFWCILINWAMFWVLDFLLNIFNDEKMWKLGTTAWFDKIAFPYRFILLALFIAGLIFLSGCNNLNNKSLLTPAQEAYWDSIPEAPPPDVFTQYQFDSAYKSNSIIKLEDFKNSSKIIPYEKMVFLFRIPAKDPEGKKLLFILLEQPIRGMFYVNEDGDMYIIQPYLEKIQQWNGKTFDVIVAVSDGENASKAVMSFKVEKSPDGKHYLKRNIA